MSIFNRKTIAAGFTALGVLAVGGCAGQQGQTYSPEDEKTVSGQDNTVNSVTVDTGNVSSYSGLIADGPSFERVQHLNQYGRELMALHCSREEIADPLQAPGAFEAVALHVTHDREIKLTILDSLVEIVERGNKPEAADIAVKVEQIKEKLTFGPITQAEIDAVPLDFIASYVDVWKAEACATFDQIVGRTYGPRIDFE